mgnify:CR=1 FL=1
MSTLAMVLTVITAIIGVALIIVILLQSDRAAGLGTISSTADTYWSKNKGNSIEGTLERYTKILGALFIILALVINFIR